MSPPFAPIYGDSNVAITANEVIVNEKNNTAKYIQKHVNDSEYDCPSPSFDLSEERENHSSLVKNKTKRINHQKRINNENSPMMYSFNNSINETPLSQNIESSKKKEEIIKLLQNNKIKLTVNSKPVDINLSNAMICGNCKKQYKKKSYFIQHLLQKKCMSTATKKNKFRNGIVVQSNATTQQYDKAGPSTSNNDHSILKYLRSEEVGKITLNTNPELLKSTTKEMNSKLLMFKSTGDSEFQKFVDCARSTKAAGALNEKVANLNMKKLHARLVKLGAGLASPPPVAQPTVHLNKAFEFVLRARGLAGTWDERARRTDDGPYTLIVSYMKAFLANVNAHCYTKCSMLSQVTLKMTDFHNNVLHDASCADLFARYGRRSLDEAARRKVRGAVERMFVAWTPARLEQYLLRGQYEYLRRRGVLELAYADGGRRPQFRRVAVPDAADPDLVLLRSFCVTGYSEGYLDFVRRSLYVFAVPLLENVVDLGVAAGAFDEAVVLDSVRRLNVAWFHTGSPLYEMSGLYERRGTDRVPDPSAVQTLRAEQLRRAATTARGASDVVG